MSVKSKPQPTTSSAPRRLSLTPLIIDNPFQDVVFPERMIWTQSALKMFRKCKRKFFWKYLLRVRPRYKQTGLLIGGAFHETLGEWYTGKRVEMKKIVARRVDLLKDAAEKYGGYYDQDDLDKLHTSVETFAGMMMGYAEAYKDDRAKWSIRRESIEAQFKVDMGDFDYEGKIDLVACEKKYDFLVEHKTAATIRGSYIDRLPLDTQVRGYVFGCTHPEGLNLPVKEVLYDVVKKCKLRRKSNEDADTFNQRIKDDYLSQPDKYFYREMLKFEKSSLDAFEYEMRQTHAEYEAIRRAAKNAKTIKVVEEIMGVADQSPLTGPNDPRAWTPNDASCEDYFRLCEYHRLCTSGLDHGTGRLYEQGDSLHEELSGTEEA